MKSYSFVDVEGKPCDPTTVQVNYVTCEQCHTSIQALPLLDSAVVSWFLYAGDDGHGHHKHTGVSGWAFKEKKWEAKCEIVDTETRYDAHGRVGY